jgi:predicted Rossmann fold flavoprotein
MSAPVVIVGAGAAGLMAAAESSACGSPAVILERGDRPGRKILVSGGTRCNLTHDAPPEVLLRAFGQKAARFLKHAVYDLPPQALRDWFAERGLPTVAEADGCVFPESGRSRDVLDALLRATADAGCTLRTGVECRRVIAGGGRVAGVETSAGRIEAASVILATGGPAWPAAGGTPGGLDLLADLGHTVVAPRPGLVPLTVAEPWVRGLQGGSLDRAELTVGRTTVGGPLVFTHEGLSGPAALDASLHIEGLPVTVRLSLLPGRTAGDVEARLVAAAAGGGSQPVRSLVGEGMPRRLVDHLLMVAGTAPETQVGQLRRYSRERLAELLTAAPLVVEQIGGWDQAMVTRGGCDLGEVNSRTMASRRVDGLYVAGELLDVAGPTGGYNLHAAFATGRLAARAALTQGN